MSTDPVNQPKSNTNTILLVVFGVLLLTCVGGSLLLVVCITAIAVLGSNANGTFTTVASKVSSAAPYPATAATRIGNPLAEGVARQFLDDIGAGRLAQARDRMTAAGKAVTQGSMQVEIDKHPALKQPRSYTLTAEPEKDGSITMTATVNGRDGSSAKVTLILRNEDGQWLVDQFIIK